MLFKKFLNTVPATLVAATAIIGMNLGASTASALPIDVTFGSDNDGLGGFTQSPSSATEIWTTDTGSVQYRNQDNGTKNSSLLRFIPHIKRAPGFSYTMTGVVTMTDGYADDNNRLGMYLFGDSAVVPDQLEAGALGLIFNTDDGSRNQGPTGDNSDDNLFITVGIDASPTLTSSPRNETTTPFAQDLFGTQVTFVTDIAFRSAGAGEELTDEDGNVLSTLAGGELVIDIAASMTTFDGDVTSVGTTVLASDFTGNHFGFVNRARARNFVEGVEGSFEDRSLPWVMDYNSFSMVPEPATMALLGLGGLVMLSLRRSA